MPAGSDPLRKGEKTGFGLGHKALDFGAAPQGMIGLALVVALYPDAAVGADRAVVPHDTSTTTKE